MYSIDPTATNHHTNIPPPPPPTFVSKNHALTPSYTKSVQREDNCVDPTSANQKHVAITGSNVKRHPLSTKTITIKGYLEQNVIKNPTAHKHTEQPKTIDLSIDSQGMCY